jgi:hypothetical protein
MMPWKRLTALAIIVGSYAMSRGGGIALIILALWFWLILWIIRLLSANALHNRTRSEP